MIQFESKDFNQITLGIDNVRLQKLKGMNFSAGEQLIIGGKPKSGWDCFRSSKLEHRDLTQIILPDFLAILSAFSLSELLIIGSH